MKSGVIHQLVHGYAKGHSLLAGSCRLTKGAHEIVTEQSDLSGPLPSGVMIPSYLTAYPVANTEYFALGRTWPDETAPRSGCVITHTLLIPRAIWTSTTLPHSFLQLHRRPDSTSLESFKRGLEIPGADSTDTHLGFITPSEAQQFVSKIFSEGLRSVVWFDCERAESVVMALLSLLWPALRAELYANTFSLQPNARVACELQLHFAPRGAQSYFSRIPKQCYMAKSPATAVRESDQEWMSQLADDFRLGKPNKEYSADLQLYGHLLGGEPTAIRSLFALRELVGRVSQTPMAAIGILDIIDSLEPGEQEGLDEKQQALDTAVSVALEAPIPSALHCLALVDMRLRRPSFSIAGRQTGSVLRGSVEKLVAREPHSLIATCGQVTPLADSYFWDGVIDGMRKAATHNPASLINLANSPEIATFVVRDAPDVARAYLRANLGDRESSVVSLVEWIHRIDRVEERTRLRKELLQETNDDVSIPLLEELLRDLRKEEVPETLETLAETTQGFIKANFRRVVSDFVCERFPNESIQWGVRSHRLLLGAAPEVIVNSFPNSAEGLEQILRQDWLNADKRCELWSAFVERAAKKQLPQWFQRRAADDPAVIETFAECHYFSARAARALEALGEQCERLPLARSKHITQFVHTVANTPLGDHFVGKTVDSAISEHIEGNVSDAKLTDILQLDPCVMWCHRVPAERVQSLFLSTSDRESWQRAWTTLLLLPQPLFQKVVEHHLIAGFTGSHRAVWTNEVAESWRAILLRSCEEHRHEKSLRLLMESTAFCLHNPRLPVGAVVSFTFPVVYEAVVSNRAPSITDEMFGYFEWDKAKKLRKDLIAAYVSSCWPPEDLAWIAAKCQILRKVFNRLRRKWNSDEYIQQMVEGLKCGNTTESLALWQDLSTMMNDSDFFEPWD